MTISVRVPGSCGELVQGVINGSPFLVTCPINRFSTASAGFDSAKGGPLREKAGRALEIICELLGISERNIKVRLSSQLLKSKGMSSSSADIAAVCKAAALLVSADITDAQIAAVAARIEPTDGVFCRGIVRFNHITGEILQYMGSPPPLKILMFDCGGSVDTVVFNQRGELPGLNEQKEEQIKRALELVEYGILHKDIKALGEGATISALANQPILYKEDLDIILDTARRYNAVGINIAHSGTLVGVLYAVDENRGSLCSCIERIQNLCPYTKYLFAAELISGGFFIC